MNQSARARATALLVVAALCAPASAGATAPHVPKKTLASVALALQLSADLGHGQKVSAAASAPGGPIVPEGCRNFGHWVSSEAKGTTCEDNPRQGRGPKDKVRPKP